MLLALIASCSSSDDDDDMNGTPGIPVDDKLVKNIQVLDVTGGEEHQCGMMDFVYDRENRLIKAAVEETDYNGGGTTLTRETMFAYKDREISYSTIHEEGYNVWISKGSFFLDKHGKAELGEITEGDEQTRFFEYEYDDNYCLTDTESRLGKIKSETEMDWSSGNIILFEYTTDVPDSKQRASLYERVEYTGYHNSASLDLTQLVCFGSEGSMAVQTMYGAKEGRFLGCFSHRVENMPEKMTAFTEGAKETKTFEYKRDRNNRIYEILVKKQTISSTAQSETKEYKYLIGY